MQETTYRLHALSAFAAIVLCLASGGTSADGRIEINALCVSTGCFSGDAPGFPVEITQPGSYRLTSNLEIDADTTAVEIGASAVSLDLGGFAILGPVSCSTGTCIPSGSGIGVSVLAAGPSSFYSFVLKNGTIRGTGDACASASAALGRIEDVTMENCGGFGLFLAGGQVRNLVVLTTGDDGVTTFFAQIRDSFIGDAQGRGQSGGWCGNTVFYNNSIPSSCTDVGPTVP